MKNRRRGTRPNSSLQSSKKFRTSFIRLTVAVLAVGAGLFYLMRPGPAESANPPNIVATDGSSLLTFNSNTPGSVTSIAITGLVGGNTIRGIDFRPANGQLYALGVTGSGGNLYTINTSTGAATPIGSLAADPTDLTNPFTTLSGTVFGVDFNPVADRLRIVSDTGQNLRVNPANGQVTTDADLNPGTPNVAEVAYTNSFAGTTSTTLYDIDFTTDTLYIQNPPNNGTLVPVGPLGVNAVSPMGFDIHSTGDRAAPTNTGYAALTVGGATGLYTINLTSGAATLVGSIQGNPTVRGLTVMQEDTDTVPAANAYGVDTTNHLVRFNTATPGTISSSTSITGMQPGENVLGIDFRPATEQLYALGSTSRLYTINTSTGAATQVGTAGAFTVSGTEFGFDFNPTVDRIRVVSNTDQNLRLNPNDGSLTATDTPLAYAPADVNSGINPNVTGSAYTNNVVGSSTTTLYGIDTNLDILVTQNPPNAGTLNTVGPLGVDASAILGFDIRDLTNAGFATMVVGGTPGLYSINLSTGAATLIGNIGGGTTLRGLAIVPAGCSATLSGTTSTFTCSAANNSLAFDQSGGLLRHNRFSVGDTGFNSDFDFDSTVPGDQTLSATDPAVSVQIDTGNGDDQVNIGSASAPASGLAAAFVFNGQGGGDILTVNDTADSTARTINVNSGSITGLGGPISHTTLESVFVNAGSNGDTININGSDIPTFVNAGGGNDNILFADGATLSGGGLDGGAGTNTLNYSAYTTPVSVDLSPGQAQTLFLARLSGAQEPGPLSSSPASGVLVGTLNPAQTAFAFEITYQGLTGSPISGTHFHNQVMGVNGPIVRGLFASEQNGLTTPSGTFSGVWSNADPTLDPPSSDAPIRPLNAPSPVTPGSTLVQELLAGRIYFNIHTLPNFPSGEIRGQLISQGTVNPATGTGGVRGFDNVVGGSNNDTITGNNNVNVLNGGPGNDSITGGLGGDQLFGDADDDTLIWNNGDGSDFMEGGAGNDTVQVNGSPVGADQFLIQVNPADSTRLRFDRTSLGLFNLNIGTTEALDFNTLGGNDKLTVDFANGNPVPAGFSSVAGIDFDGGTGSNSLVLQRSAGSFSASTEAYFATGPGAGDIIIGGTIRFSNLAPVDDTLPVTDFVFTAPVGVPVVNIVDGPVVSGFNTTQVNDGGNASFELINFANKTNATVNTNFGDQLVTVNNPTAATGLTSLTVNGGPGSDTFNVKASPTVPIDINGGLPVSAPGDTLNYDTEGRTFSGDTTPPSGNINSPGVQTVSFSGIESLNLLNLQISISDVTVTEGDSGFVNAVFNVTLPGPSSQTITVDYVTANGTATAPVDYQSVNGTLTFAPGQTTRTITVPVNGDTTPEADETFFVNLSNPTNSVLSDSQGLGTITNDDPGGTLAFSASSYNVNETASTATITVARTGSTLGSLTVNYATSNGTATSGLDYGNTSGTLFFGSGETSKTFDVPIINDSLSEGTETVNLSLSLPTGGATLGTQSTAILFILDDEAPPPPDLYAVTTTNNLLRLNANAPGTIISSVAITGLQSGENILNIDFRPATGQLYALGSTSRLYTINTSTGAATQVGSSGAFTLSGTDFGADFNPVVDRLRVVSDTDQNIRINPNDGTLTATDTPLSYASGDVNFGANPNVTGLAYTNNSAATATTTLYGIDSNLDVLVRQGSVDGTPTSPNSGQLFTIGSLGVNTTGLAGFDIRQTSNTAYASLTSPGDTSSRLYTVNTATGATTLIGTIGGSALIRDIALLPAGSFQFSSSTAAVAENAGKLTVTINRTGDTTGAATVNVATSDGTATQKGDYTIRLATVSFNPGETSKTIDVFITDDGYVESSETFTISLSSPTGDFTLDGTSTQTVTITDNDAASSNPIATTNFFVRQHYIDFLNREPDPPGFNGWVAILNGCAPGNTSCDRVEVSSAFYRSDEFQVRGYFLYRFYRAGLGRNPSFREFMMDLSRTTGFLTDAQLEAAKVAFVADFMARPEFKAKYDATTDPAGYVSLIEQTAGVTLSNRQALITGLQNGTETRATVLRKAMESTEVAVKFFNEAFVVEAYFGYLRRDPDGAFQAWVTLLNQTSDRRVIVNGFVNSNEYVQRFGP